MDYKTIKPIILTLGFELLELAKDNSYLEDQIKARVSRCLSAIQREYEIEVEDADFDIMGFLT